MLLRIAIGKKCADDLGKDCDSRISEERKPPFRKRSEPSSRRSPLNTLLLRSHVSSRKHKTPQELRCQPSFPILGQNGKIAPSLP